MKVGIILCRICAYQRYDDGTRCDQCGGYENPNIKYHGSHFGWRDLRSVRRTPRGEEKTPDQPSIH